MKNPIRLFMLAVLVLGLNGCGLKGPLYNPPAEKPADQHKLTSPAAAHPANPGDNGQATSGTVQP